VRAQALVELAIMLPVLMLVALGFTEVGFLVVTKAHQDRATSTVAEYAATRHDDSWHAVAAHELPGCDVTVNEPQPGLIEAVATCQYQPHVLPGWSGLPMTSRESATRASEPASPGPSAGGSL
jgi:hypothetical protein